MKEHFERLDVGFKKFGEFLSIGAIALFMRFYTLDAYRSVELSVELVVFLTSAYIAVVLMFVQFKWYSRKLIRLLSTLAVVLVIRDFDKNYIVLLFNLINNLSRFVVVAIAIEFFQLAYFAIKKLLNM